MRMEQVIKGKCVVCPDSFTVYEIIPEKRWTMDRMDPLAMSDWIFEDHDPQAKDHPGYFKEQGYTIVVGGTDFGCGSKSVEHPMAALQGAGVKLILAESFSRYSFRNALNLGLAAVSCPGISGFVKTGDVLEVNIVTGELMNLTAGTVMKTVPLSGFALKLIEAGGTLNYIMQNRNHI